jgi:hypothetical protein
VNTAAQNVIDTVFNEFNILFQKDTFLTNRLTTYINKDFSMRIKSGMNMTQYQNDLMTITQKHLVDKLIEVHQVNPTNSMVDLARAQVVNKRNIETLEEVFRDPLYKMILQVKAVADGGGEAAIKKALNDRYQKELAARNAAAKYMVVPMSSNLGARIWGWLTNGTSIRAAHPDLYQEPANSRKVTGIDDKFGSFAQFHAQLCAQTLSFENREFFFDICNQSVVKSFYSPKKGAGDLDLRYNDYMKTAAWGQAIRKSAFHSSNNICAYNKFIIRNMVKWMKDQDAELYESNDTF